MIYINYNIKLYGITNFLGMSVLIMLLNKKPLLKNMSIDLTSYNLYLYFFSQRT